MYIYMYIYIYIYICIYTRAHARTRVCKHVCEIVYPQCLVRIFGGIGKTRKQDLPYTTTPPPNCLLVSR